MPRTPRSLKLGYITSGFRDHALPDAFSILAELGYAGVGLTLDVGHLDPMRSSREEVLRVRDDLRRFGLAIVVETGGRYILDPRRKHWPSLVSAEGRERRIDFYRRAIEIAEALGSRVVSLWSGAQDPALGRDESFGLLVEGLRLVERCARERGIMIGFEPEPGMLVGDLEAYRELRSRLSGDEMPALKLTLDVGHLQCTEEPPHARWIREFAADLANVHLDDVKGRMHEHLPFGEGEIDFPPVLRALEEIDYSGLALVELGRHSHEAPKQAERAIKALRRHVSPSSLAR